MSSKERELNAEYYVGMYLEWLHEYNSVEVFAKDYGMSKEDAIIILNEGNILYHSDHLQDLGFN